VLQHTVDSTEIEKPTVTASSFASSMHWLKITERFEYKLLSLIYKVLTTTQPSYLHNLFTVQPPGSTRSSSLVTLAHPSVSSSLHITDRSLPYASHRLRNQLLAFLH